MGKLRVALLFFIVMCMGNIASLGFTCKEAERNALLSLKHSFINGTYYLTSWVGEDCCNWYGIGCDNVTGNVIKLDLRSVYPYQSILEAREVNHTLLELKYLTYLDLSGNDFNGSRIPEFFGSMRQLQHLDLSYTNFRGKVPPQLGNLTKLVFLDLSTHSLEAEANNLEWAFKLESLQHLDLSGIDLSQALDSLFILSKLPSLSVLTMSLCGLGNSHFVTVNSTFSFSALQDLDFSLNNFSGPIPGFIQNLRSVTSLSLSHNYFNGPIPYSIQNFSFLTSLDLSHNHFNRVDGGILNTMSCLCRLYDLDLSSNQLQEQVSESHVNFSRCSRCDSQYLHIKYINIIINGQAMPDMSSLLSIDLSDNNLEGLIPPSLVGLSPLNRLFSLDFSYNNFGVMPSVIGSFSSLVYFDLSFNHLESLPPSFQGLSSLYQLSLSHNHFRVVPPSIGSLPSLGVLDLSYNNLSVINQVSFPNLSSLQFLDISSNSLILDISPDWIPPFQLRFFTVLPCRVNSQFPNWILSQKNLEDLDLSDSGIFGPLPINIGNAMPSLRRLQLANNHINGSIPRSLCGIAGLGVLDLQKNSLSGVIPDCWVNSPIVGMELSSNRLSGYIPNSLTKVATLQLLSLNNNSLVELPLSLSNSPRLTIFDVGRNNLHGEIPPWNGANFPFLQILILRENRLNGTIPLQLCLFHSLQIIDLASNNLDGTIPHCFGYFQEMGSMQYLNSPTTTSNITSEIASEPSVSPHEWSAVEVIKGDEREYTTNLHLLVNMDLSCNHLVGVISGEITSLSHLFGLNLSHNHLNGTIPREIGKMRSLESFDLSFNNLSGSIPESISSLDSLSKMNFSFNNLEGQIPTGRHLQTLNDSSIYMGNPGLCGEPLPKKCFGDDTAHPPTSEILEDGGDNKKENMWFYMVIMLGFAAGFWGVIGILVVHKRWGHAYFQIAEELADWIYVTVAVMIARNQRKMRR